jgi:hypothetical protein
MIKANSSNWYHLDDGANNAHKRAIQGYFGAINVKGRAINAFVGAIN